MIIQPGVQIIKWIINYFIVYTLLNGYLMVYTKAGFVICLVHRNLDCLFLLAPDEYPDGFGTPPFESNFIGSPLFGM